MKLPLLPDEVLNNIFEFCDLLTLKSMGPKYDHIFQKNRNIVIEKIQQEFDDKFDFMMKKLRLYHQIHQIFYSIRMKDDDTYAKTTLGYKYWSKYKNIQHRRKWEFSSKRLGE